MYDGRGKLLTSATITEASGEDAHETLDEVEVIFGNYEQLDPQALRQCSALRRFAMINCRLQRIAHLEPVAATLVHLNLTNQRLSRIEGLSTLSQLRALYLQHNLIERIEGLNSCCKLQILWLYDNRISRVENLAGCSDLRELWLQSNRIQTLDDGEGGGFSATVNLRSLNLSNNLIRSVDEFQHLRRLIVLRQLAFQDEHFGSNPVVDVVDYRSIALATLKQLRQLDGDLIDASERVNAVDQFLTQTLEFNDRVAELMLAYHHELDVIAARKESGVSNSRILQRELVEALNDVESRVLEGQAQLRDEKERQRQLREQNGQLLRDNVEALKLAFHDIIDRQYKQREQELDNEDKGCQVMEMEILAEQDQATTIATVQTKCLPMVAFQQLLEHSPDHRFIAAAFDDGAHAASEQSMELRLLQVYRYYHRELIEGFSVRQDEGVPGEASELYLYMIVDSNETGSILHRGIGSGTPDDYDKAKRPSAAHWVFLFSNPITAAQYFSGSTFDLEDLEQGGSKSSRDKNEGHAPLVEFYNLLLCRVRVIQAIELYYPEQASQDPSVGTLLSICDPVDPVLPPPPSSFLVVEIPPTIGGGGHVYMARRDVLHAAILPQFFILCSKRAKLVEADTSALMINNDTASRDATATLGEFHQRLQYEVDEYHARLYREMDPAFVRARTELTKRQNGLREQLQEIDARVAEEKSEQNQLLRCLVRGDGGRKIL